MPLVSIAGELKKAEQGGYAIPCFDTFDMMGTQGIFAALEGKRSPGIVGLYSRLLDGPDARAIAQMVRTLAEDATVPISLILDHGADFEHCMKALTYGFSDVMYDGSKLSFEENITNTRTIVRAAHAVGAGVEAELGHVGTGRTYQAFGAQGQGFTDPGAAAEFVSETGIDYLAVAVGTAHGLYEGEPKLALELLQEITSRVDIPLVLHGGSGLADEQYRSAIGHGISKINVFTNLAVSAGQRVTEVVRAKDASYFDVIGAISEAFQRECERVIDVFGASGQA